MADTGAGAMPEVKGFSGTDVRLLRDLYAWPTTFGGGVRAGAMDMNKDGRADLLAAGPGGLPELRAETRRRRR